MVNYTLIDLADALVIAVLESTGSDAQLLTIETLSQKITIEAQNERKENENRRLAAHRKFTLMADNCR
jgi:hypothetical protein